MGWRVMERVRSKDCDVEGGRFGRNWKGMNVGVSLILEIDMAS